MAAHYSPGIQQILRETTTLEKPTILDLGATSTNLINYFSQRKCHLFFEDLPDFLFGQTLETNPESIHDQLDQYLLDYGDKQFDIVLAWDLLNYIELPTVKLLMEKINRHCRPDTLFHMIRYTGAKVPIMPRRFHVQDDGLLQFEEGDLQQRKVAIHSTVRLLQHMTDQFMESTLMNESGMHDSFVEHVLRYKPTKHRKSVVFNRQPENTGASANDYAAPGLEKLYSHLQSIDRPRILIFSHQPSRAYQFFSRFSDEVYVEDVYNTLQWKQMQSVEGESSYSRDLLNYPADIRFDAILCWDLFNYCNPAVIHKLGTLLSRYCHANTLVHFFSYTRTTIPEKPVGFAIDGHGKVQSTHKGKLLPRKHNLTAAGLMKLLPNFYVASTYLNQSNRVNGICEYLFNYTEPKLSSFHNTPPNMPAVKTMPRAS